MVMQQQEDVEVEHVRKEEESSKENKYSVQTVTCSIATRLAMKIN